MQFLPFSRNFFFLFFRGRDAILFSRKIWKSKVDIGQEWRAKLTPFCNNLLTSPIAVIDRNVFSIVEFLISIKILIISYQNLKEIFIYAT